MKTLLVFDLGKSLWKLGVICTWKDGFGNLLFKVLIFVNSLMCINWGLLLDSVSALHSLLSFDRNDFDRSTFVTCELSRSTNWCCAWSSILPSRKKKTHQKCGTRNRSCSTDPTFIQSWFPKKLQQESDKQFIIFSKRFATKYQSLEGLIWRLDIRLSVFMSRSSVLLVSFNAAALQAVHEPLRRLICNTTKWGWAGLYSVCGIGVKSTFHHTNMVQWVLWASRYISCGQWHWERLVTLF